MVPGSQGHRADTGAVVSSFTRARFDPIPGKRREGRQVYRCLDDLWFWIGKPDSGCGVEIKAGFETDFASMPAWLVRLVPRWVRDQLAKSSALHDRMREDLQFALTNCDGLFWVAMKADGVNAILCGLAFRAVRLNTSRTKHNP